MVIHSVFSPEFRAYGQVLEGYDFSNLFRICREVIRLPGDGFDYCASLPELEALPVATALQDRAFGGLPIQIGCCFGHNRTLNCLEYHKSSELNIAADPVVLLLGRQADLEHDCLKTDTVQAFLVPTGTGVELFATTLHYAPCHVERGGYRVLCVLPRGTNGPKPSGIPPQGEGRLCMGANKWLIAHTDAPEAAAGAFVGLKGENLMIEI